MNTKRNWSQVAVVVVMVAASLSSIAMSASHPHGARRNILAADLCGVPFVSEFDQYLAATEWAEEGGPVPTALTVSCIESSYDLSLSLAGLGEESGVRWEQYSAAVGGRELSLDAAPVNTTGKVRTFAPGAPTGEHDLDLFARYLDLVANRGDGPTFASEADRGMPE